MRSRRVVVLVAVVVGLLGVVVPAGAAPHHQTQPAVQLGHADSATPHTAHDITGEQEIPLGAWRDERGRKHVSRVYATFDLSGLAGTDVLGGVLRIGEASAADCAKRAIEVWQTAPVTSTPTWRTRPAEVRKLDEIRTSTFCPGTIAFDVSSAMAARGSVTFEIRVPADVERDPGYGRKLSWYTSVGLTARYNSPPSVLPQYQYNAGFPCDTTAPYRRVGGFHGTLQALAADPDEGDVRGLAYEFAVWPQNDPAARLTLTDDNGSVEYASRVEVPDSYLADEGTYSWQVRVTDGVATSDWSPTCSYVVDRSDPSPPAVSSDAPGQFTFDGNGDLDTWGFEYTWGEMSVPVCSYGEYTILTCPEPFSGRNKVLATTPGGTATVSLTPPGPGVHFLRVRAIDEAGNRSDTVLFEYES